MNIVQRGLGASEAETTLKTSSQGLLNKIEHRLVECKRIFQNTAGDTAFLARVQKTTPTVMSGSQLPLSVTNGGISPSTSTFNAAGVGNELFFASIDSPLDVVATDSSGSTETVRIDLYHFNYYYLAQGGEMVGGQPMITPYEWHSVSYADYQQITSISDAVESSSTATGLVASGVNYAWDPSTGTVGAAFYQLGIGTVISAQSHLIPQKSAQSMLNLTTGILSSGFHYGVSPNTSVSFSTSKPVPKFATAAGNFPSGFEVIVVGANSARQVFIRLVLVAQGAFKNPVAQEQTVLVSARDLW